MDYLFGFINFISYSQLLNICNVNNNKDIKYFLSNKAINIAWCPLFRVKPYNFVNIPINSDIFGITVTYFIVSKYILIFYVFLNIHFDIIVNDFLLNFNPFHITFNYLSMLYYYNGISPLHYNHMEKSHILLVNFNFMTHKIFKNENCTDVNVATINFANKCIIDSYLFSLYYDKNIMQFLRFIKYTISIHTWILILCKCSSHLDSFQFSSMYASFIYLYHMIEILLIESYTNSIIMKNALVKIYYSYINNLDECFYVNCHILLLLKIKFLYEIPHSDSNSLYAYYAKSKLIISHIFYIKLYAKFMPFVSCGDILEWCKSANVSFVQSLLLFNYIISVLQNSKAPKHLLQPQGVCYNNLRHEGLLFQQRQYHPYL